MRILIAVALLCAVAACGQAEEAKAPEAPVAAAPAAPLTPEEATARRIADLVTVNAAIRAYHAANGEYPRSERGGFATTVTGLTIPAEPTGNVDPNGPQYRYASNGTDYKLIAHGVSGQCNATIERDGVRMDPIRTRADGQCWAYGFWTEGYSRF